MYKFSFLLICCLIISNFACTHAKDSTLVRQPAVAGSFYPGGAEELKTEVDKFLDKVPDQNLQGKIIAVIAPHAGYMYSGQTAAYSFKLLKNKNIDTVVLIGNSHNYPLTKAAVYAKGKFKTPLGNVPVHKELAANLIDNSNLFKENTRAHRPEHSLEVELPFLQRTLGDFKVVPILLSSRFSLNDCKSMGNMIAQALSKLNLAEKAIIVASTDMSHYPTWVSANMVDGKALESLKKLDPKELDGTIKGLMSKGINNLSCVFCGQEAVYTTMYAAKALGTDSIKVLRYTNSGDVSGDRSRVVGYCSAVLINSKGKLHKKKEANVEDFRITETSQKELLKIARGSIEHYLENRDLKPIKYNDQELTTPAAVFVTLTKNGMLRGCIGTTVPQAPLCDAVNEMAVSAAFQDYRFPKVSQNELKDIHIEISILSPMRRVTNPDEIKPHVHGVVVKGRNNRGGLFLPQVWEHFEDKEGFMSELCYQKAGLSRNAWKDPETELYIFTVFAFEE